MDTRPRKGETLPRSWYSERDKSLLGSSGWEWNSRPMPFPNPFIPGEHIQLCSFHRHIVDNGTLVRHDVLTHRPHSFFTLPNQTIKESLLSIIAAGEKFTSPSAADMMNTSMTLLADMAPLQRVCPGVTIQALGRFYAPLDAHKLDPQRVNELRIQAEATVPYCLGGLFYLSRGMRSVWSEQPYPDLSPDENRNRLRAHLAAFHAQVQDCRVGQEFLVKDWLSSFAETKFNCSYLDFHYNRIRVGPAKDNVLPQTRARVRVSAGPIPKL